MLLKKLFGAVSLLYIVLSLVTSINAQSQTLVGVWRSGNDPVALHQFNSWDAFGDKWKELAGQNQRLVDIEVLRTGNTTKYTGVWRKGSDDYALFQNANWDDFVGAWRKFSKDNLRLVDLEVFQAGQEIAYVGVWRAGTDAQALHRLTSWEAFVAKWKELAAQNLHLVDIEAIPIGNQIHYIGAWRAGKEGHLFYAKTYSDFTAKWKELGAQKQRLVEVELLRVGAALHYIGVWNPGQDGYALYQAESWEDFTTKWKELNSQNLRLIDLAIAEKPGKPAGPPEPKGKPLGLQFDDKPTKVDPVSGMSFPTDMPAIHYPEFIGCNTSDRKKVQDAWAYAHFSTWRAQQVINYIASHDNKEELWNKGFVANSKTNWSPRAWFGEFKDSRFRFQLIHEAINKLWNDRFLAKKYNFKVKCREQENDGPHPCYIKDDNGEFKYSANHITLGTINFCPAFLDESDSVESRAQTVVHEILHWLSAQGLYISDTHTHSDKSGAICKTKTEKIYGTTLAQHVATSDGCTGNDTLHREIAARSNDNYAYFIQRLGMAIRSGALTSFH
jgi:hypothetical protein